MVFCYGSLSLMRQIAFFTHLHVNVLVSCFQRNKTLFIALHLLFIALHLGKDTNWLLFFSKVQNILSSFDPHMGQKIYKIWIITTIFTDKETKYSNNFGDLTRDNRSHF